MVSAGIAGAQAPVLVLVQAQAWLKVWSERLRVQEDVTAKAAVRACSARPGREKVVRERVASSLHCGYVWESSCWSGYCCRCCCDRLDCDCCADSAGRDSSSLDGEARRVNASRPEDASSFLVRGPWPRSKSSSYVALLHGAPCKFRAWSSLPDMRLESTRDWSCDRLNWQEVGKIRQALASLSLPATIGSSIGRHFTTSIFGHWSVLNTRSASHVSAYLILLFSPNHHHLFSSSDQ